jgi:hypothetical protein
VRVFQMSSFEELRTHFSKRFDEFLRGLPGAVGVVMTCRTQEYEELFDAHFEGLGLGSVFNLTPKVRWPRW